MHQSGAIAIDLRYSMCNQQQRTGHAAVRGVLLCLFFFSCEKWKIVVKVHCIMV